MPPCSWTSYNCLEHKMQQLCEELHCNVSRLVHSVFAGYLNKDMWASMREKDKKERWERELQLLFFLHIAVSWVIVGNNNSDPHKKSISCYCQVFLSFSLLLVCSWPISIIWVAPENQTNQQISSQNVALGKYHFKNYPTNEICQSLWCSLINQEKTKNCLVFLFMILCWIFNDFSQGNNTSFS